MAMTAVLVADSSSRPKIMLATMAKVAGVPLKDLQNIMERLSMSQLSANQSFDSLLQSFMLGRRIFPQSLRAQTQLFRMYQEMGKEKVQYKLGELGVSTTNALGKIRPAEDIFKQLIIKLDTLLGKVIYKSLCDGY